MDRIMITRTDICVYTLDNWNRVHVLQDIINSVLVEIPLVYRSNHVVELYLELYIYIYIYI